MSPALQRIAALESEGPLVQELQSSFNCYKICKKTSILHCKIVHTRDSMTEEENENETQISGNAKYSRCIN